MREAWRDHPLVGLDLELMEVFLRRCWCRATASPGDRDAWSEENPSKGQCAATVAMLWKSLMEDDGLEAEILRAEVEGFGSHYWLRLPDGTEIDLTRGQFPEGTVIPEGEQRSIEALLDSERAKSARTRERAELLERLVEDAFGEWFMDGVGRGLEKAVAETVEDAAKKATASALTGED